MLNTFVQGIGIFIIALVGGFAGALSKHVFAFLGKKTERKLNTRDTLEALIIEMLDEIRKLSIKYWSQDEQLESKALSARIVALNDHLPDLYIQLFADNVETSRQLDVKMNRLSHATTGGQFQQNQRKANFNTIAEIEKFTMSLKVEVQLKKANLPHPWI